MLRKILWDMLPVRRAVTFSATSDEEGSTTDAVKDVFDVSGRGSVVATTDAVRDVFDVSGRVL